MIKSATIDNFRGLSSVHLKSLNRINLLIGPNGSGKTALLEALFLAVGGSAEIGFRLKQWRGRDAQFQKNNAFEGMWADLFGTTVGDKSATIEIQGNPKIHRRVIISKAEYNTIVGPNGSAEPSNIGLQFAIKDMKSKKPAKVVIPFMLPDGKIDAGPALQLSVTNFIPSRTQVAEAETAMHYSKLKVEGAEASFDEVFLREFSFIKSVSVESPFGLQSLYGRMSNGRLLPLSMISGGISHLAGILVRIAAMPNSIMFVDEIDNGIFYNRLESMWSAVINLANERNVQIFASTHSIESLRSLQAVTDKAGKKDISFIRHSINNDDSRINIEQIEGDRIFKAMAVGEVR